MKTLKTGFFFAAVLLFTFTALTKAQETPRAAVAWQVTKYDITANLPATERSLTAKAVLTIKNSGTDAGSNLSLRISRKAEVSGVKINGGDVSFVKAEDRLPAFQLLRLRLPQNVQPNETVNLTVEYKISVLENSGVNTISPLSSQFLPILTTNADTAALQLWYPTPTSPFAPRGGDFAPFRLTVNASDETIISSGKRNGNSFEQSLNAQPFFITGSFETVEGANEAKGISAYLTKGAGSNEKKRAEEIISLANAAKAFIASALGTAPDVPIKLVAVRRGAGFADGGVILLDEAIFRRQKIDANSALIIGESIAKLWLGNQTLIRNEGYGVIREGLARFIALQIIEKQFGKEAADAERLRQRIAYTNVAKRDLPLTQTSPLDDSYFPSVQNKGAMVWRLIAKIIGNEQFFNIVRANLQNSPNGLSLINLRNALNSQNSQLKSILDYELDQVTDADLIIGLPQLKGNETVAALRNLGDDVSVSVTATTERGEKLNTQVAILSKSFGEATFKTAEKIVKVEIDPEKFYPQVDYANDIAPRQSTDNDWQLEISQSFVRQEFTKTETAARRILQSYPHLDEARTWLGRSLLAQNKLSEAEKEFQTALNEKLPTARTLALANIGLGDVAVKLNKNTEAINFYDLAVKADAEYGANLAARAGRIKAENVAPKVDESIKQFFAQLDKAILSGKKSEIETYILNGEMSKFAGGVASGQPEQWQTKILRTEQLDAGRTTVEVALSVKRLGKDTESGTAVFTLAKVGNDWKLNAVDLFEVK